MKDLFKDPEILESFSDPKETVSSLINWLPPIILEELISNIDENPEFYQQLCEAFEAKYPERARKLFGRETATDGSGDPTTEIEAKVKRTELELTLRDWEDEHFW